MNTSTVLKQPVNLQHLLTLPSAFRRLALAQGHIVGRDTCDIVKSRWSSISSLSQVYDDVVEANQDMDTAQELKKNKGLYQEENKQKRMELLKYMQDKCTIEEVVQMHTSLNLKQAHSLTPAEQIQKDLVYTLFNAKKWCSARSTMSARDGVPSHPFRKFYDEIERIRHVSAQDDQITYTSFNIKIYSCVTRLPSDFHRCVHVITMAAKSESLKRFGDYIMAPHETIPCVYVQRETAYKKVQSSVRLDGCNTEWFDVDVGVRQGCVISPLLFDVFVDGLAREMKALGLGVAAGEGRLSLLLYADDIVVLANSVADLQRMMSAVEGFCRRWRLQVNMSKTKVVEFGSRGVRKIFLTNTWGHTVFTSNRDTDDVVEANQDMDTAQEMKRHKKLYQQELKKEKLDLLKHMQETCTIEDVRKLYNSINSKQAASLTPTEQIQKDYAYILQYYPDRYIQLTPRSCQLCL